MPQPVLRLLFLLFFAGRPDLSYTISSLILNFIADEHLPFSASAYRGRQSTKERSGSAPCSSAAGQVHLSHQHSVFHSVRVAAILHFDVKKARFNWQHAGRGFIIACIAVVFKQRD